MSALCPGLLCVVIGGGGGGALRAERRRRVNSPIPPAAAATASAQCARPFTLVTLDVRGSLAQGGNYVRRSARGTVIGGALGRETVAQSSIPRESDMTTQAATADVKDPPGTRA
jgi:hypothetical protein